MKKLSKLQFRGLLIEFIHISVAAFFASLILGLVSFVLGTDGKEPLAIILVVFVALVCASPFIVFSAIFLHFMRLTRLSRNQSLALLGLIFLVLFGLLFGTSTPPIWEVQPYNRFWREMAFAVGIMLVCSLIFYLIFRRFRDGVGYTNS